MTDESETVVESSSANPGGGKLRRFLVGLARFVLVILLGASVAGASFYLLRKFGY
jgi:hypothetical protein